MPRKRKTTETAAEVTSDHGTRAKRAHQADPVDKSNQQKALPPKADKGSGGRGRKKKEVGQAESSEEFTKIQWQSPDFHHLTDKLITFIEDDEYARTALGFAPGKGGNAGKTNGEKQTYYHKKYATKVLKNDSSENWAGADEGKLAIAIKNRISQLKKAFSVHKKIIGTTGAGLEDENEILPGSEIQNKWDEIKKEFPWFYRVRDLIGRDPRLETTVINASSDVDIDLLGRSTSRSRASSGDLIDDDMMNELEEPDEEAPMQNISENDDNDEFGSPGFDNDGGDQDPTLGASKTAATTRVSGAPEKLSKRKEPVAPTAPIPSYGNKKSKGFLSELTETLNRNQEVKLEATKSKEKTRIKLEEIRQQGNIKLEKLRLFEQQKQREHEEKMMRMRLEIAQTQYGYNSGLGASFGAGSSFGAGGSANSTAAAAASPMNLPAGPSSTPGPSFTSQNSPNGLSDSAFLTPSAHFETPAYAPSVSGESYVGLLLNNGSDGTIL